ncbi:OmpA family protein [Desulfovibrio sp. OttesenSCG-928-C14]|nr:OmpA family protein [Desulfovibrio sp. OttesenSCG-928-C14]
MRKSRSYKASEPDFQAPWLITLTDLMTLMLTFFVTLVALSVFDENSKQRVMDSVSTIFASRPDRANPFPSDRDDPRQAGGPAAERDRRLEEIKLQLLETNTEIRISQNSRFVLISINSDILFPPGGVGLSPEGASVLDQLVPLLLAGRAPMLVAGHSAPRMEEEGLLAWTDPEGQGLSPGWALSLERALTVYRHYVGRGVNPAWLFMEGYGEYRPRFSNDDPSGRRKNRRVDLVLDKKHMALSGSTDKLLREEGGGRDYYFRDFRFDLAYPEAEGNLNIGGEVFAPASSGSGVPAGQGASSGSGALGGPALPGGGL